jgi:uncharacterized membrane protein
MEPNPPSLPPPPAPPPPPYAPPVRSDTSAKIIYVLYLLSLGLGFTHVVGVVMAYMNVGDAPEPLRTHYRFQIRTFWLSLLYGLVGGLLILALGLGLLVWAFMGVWLVVRCVKGLKYLDRGEPYANATTWLW